MEHSEQNKRRLGMVQTGLALFVAFSTTVLLIQVFVGARKVTVVKFPRQHVVASGNRNGHPVAAVHDNHIQIEGDLCNLTDTSIDVAVTLNWTRYEPKGFGAPIAADIIQTLAPNSCERHALVCEPASEIQCMSPFPNTLTPSVIAEVDANPNSLWQVTGVGVPFHSNAQSEPITSEPFYLR